MMQSILETGNKISVFKEYYPEGERDFENLSNKIVCLFYENFARYVIFDGDNNPILIRETGPVDGRFQEYFKQDNFLSTSFAKSVFIFHATTIELVPEGFANLFVEKNAELTNETQIEVKNGRLIYRAQLPTFMPDSSQWETREIGAVLLNLLKKKKLKMDSALNIISWEHQNILNLMLVRNKQIEFGNSFVVKSPEEAFYFISNVLKQLNADFESSGLIYVYGNTLNETFEEIAKKYISEVKNLDLLWGDLNNQHPLCKFDLSKFGLLLNVEL